MKLYDMETEEWRAGDFERGSVWRSTAAYQCGICLVKTNRWIMGGYPGMGPRILCPGDLYEEHDALDEIIKEYEKIKDAFAMYRGIDHTLEQSRVDKLFEHFEVKQDLLTTKIAYLQSRFPKTLDDIEGIGQDAPVISYIPGSRYGGDKKSLSSLID